MSNTLIYKDETEDSEVPLCFAPDIIREGDYLVLDCSQPRPHPVEAVIRDGKVIWSSDNAQP